MGNSKYKICSYCHVAFDSKLEKCPECHRIISSKESVSYADKEGNGRKYHVGGEACDYCPHCYGSADWCPIMDND